MKFGKQKDVETISPKPKKNFKKSIGIFILIILAVVLVNGSYYTIQEEEQAVVCTMGKPKEVTTPGLHFKIPFVQTVTKVNTTIQGFHIGYGSDGEEQEAMMITSDYNFIHVDFYAEYRVTDPVAALYASAEPEQILRNIAQNCIRTTIGSYTVDSVLTTGKNEIQANIKQMILDKLDSYDIGIQLVNITIQDAEPPTEEVSAAFKEVETAKQGKETAINNANKYRNEQIPSAKAQVDRIKQDAEAQKQERINEANGQVARFNSMYEEYVKFPQVTKKRMFYETMETVLPDVKVVIDGGDGNTSTVLPLDSFVESSNTMNKASVEEEAD